MIDRRIVKYNVDFVFRNFKYSSGAVSIDLSDVKNMKATVEADWSPEYAKLQLKKVLTQATGIGGGWNLDNIQVERTIFSMERAKYNFSIQSRLYVNLRRIYERPKGKTSSTNGLNGLS